MAPQYNLHDRLKLLEETHKENPPLDAKMEVFSSVFDAVITKTKLYGGLLSVIKDEYENTGRSLRGLLVGMNSRCVIPPFPHVGFRVVGV